ncbi:nuclear transport factor 2 family protein [Chondromyces crocatus]|uniref:SnoaL-like domain-containing protein n=1 Tax=Chondromyces crocatus TaxID=52 RepID=A0A0K1ELH0_CHOCO|nr:nuclear transport factor 2 family protein [Chondromyces crocatus]AKT41729.1 uncharacterized protein CMC5_059400 [Chondromyces crocatus]
MRFLILTSLALGLNLLACGSDDGSSSGAGGNGAGGSAGTEGGGAANSTRDMDTLLDALGAADRETLTRLVDPAVIYVDTIGRVEGVDALVAHLTQRRMGWVRSSPVDAHHTIQRTRVRGTSAAPEDLLVTFQPPATGGSYSHIVLLPGDLPPVEQTGAISQAYQDAWTEAEPTARAALLETSWADDGYFVDPRNETTGRDALDQMIAGFLESGAGEIRPGSGTNEQHGVLHFAWNMFEGDKPVLHGVDVGFFAADGRISHILGFWGPLQHRDEEAEPPPPEPQP